MNIRQKMRKPDVCIIVFFALWLCCIVFLVWKARYGYANNDETFYLTIPYRLLQGDALITEEWNVSQLSGVILYPIMWIYMRISGSTEGIVLSFRYIYVFFQAIAAFYLFWRLKDRSKTCALLSSLFFMLYAPFNIMNLSYNSMGIQLFAAATVTLTTQKRLTDLFFSGVMFAGAVLCCPHLIILYVLSLIYIGAEVLLRKKKGLLKKTVQFSFAAALIAILFFLFVFSRASVAEFLKSIPMILEDPYHVINAWWSPFIGYFNGIYHSCLFSEKIFIMCAILFGIIIFDRKAKTRRYLYYTAAVILSFSYAISFMYTNRFVNYIMMPVNILGLFSYLLTKDKDTPLFVNVYVPSFIYGFLINISSNQGFYVISSVSSVAAIASTFFIGRCLQESSLWGTGHTRNALYNTAAKGLTVLYATFLFACLLFMRGMYTFWDQNTNLLDCRISSGPNKGIYTTLGECEVYYAYTQGTSQLRDISKGNVLYYSPKTWMYLADDKRISAFSSWLAINDDHIEIERLEKYYNYNPSKTPDYIFVDKVLNIDPSKVMDGLDINGTIQTNDVGYIITVSGEGTL